MLIVIHLPPSCCHLKGALLGVAAGLPLADICALELTLCVWKALEDVTSMSDLFLPLPSSTLPQAGRPLFPGPALPAELSIPWADWYACLQMASKAAECLSKTAKALSQQGDEALAMKVLEDEQMCGDLLACLSGTKQQHSHDPARRVDAITQAVAAVRQHGHHVSYQLFM